MNLNEIRFKAVEGDFASCKGCMFQGQKARVCLAVSDIAQVRGIPDCDERSKSGKTYIYVPDDSDPRQIALDGRGEVVG